MSNKKQERPTLQAPRFTFGFLPLQFSLNSYLFSEDTIYYIDLEVVCGVCSLSQARIYKLYAIPH